jgi:hypothetical protein
MSTWMEYVGIPFLNPFAPTAKLLARNTVEPRGRKAKSAQNKGERPVSALTGAPANAAPASAVEWSAWGL